MQEKHYTSTGRRPQFWRVAQRCCQLAAGVDVAYFFLFYYFGSPFLAWINVASVVMYAIAYFALKKRHNTLAISLIWIEVLVHAALGTLMVGWDSGFHYFLLMFIPALFATLPVRSACLAVTVLWAYYVGLNLTMQWISPIQPISAGALRGLNLFNLTVVFAMFSYLAYFYVNMVSNAQRKLRGMATTDSLTLLFNRRHMTHLAGKAIARHARDPAPIAFLLLDIDHFKRINDTHGHDVGDQVLVEIARTLGGRLRSQDFLGRWGGEEFLAILPGTDRASALATAERIRESIERRDWRINGVYLRLTVSIGVAEYREGESQESAIARADAALYRGKEAGRNRVEPAQAPD